MTGDFDKKYSIKPYQVNFSFDGRVQANIWSDETNDTDETYGYGGCGGDGEGEFFASTLK